jgi:sulfite reductase (NADPH) flavoprotein alpha-component
MSSEINQANGLAAGLNENQWSQINQATAALNPQQLTWLSGYLAGLAQAVQPAVLPQLDSSSAKFLTIL